MKNIARVPMPVMLAVIFGILLIGSLGFIAWQNLVQYERDISSARVQSNQVSLDFIEGTYEKAVTSTLEGWTVSLQVPSMWKANVDYTTFYNYDARQKEIGNIVTIVHPSEKVHITLRHHPFFSADGLCGATAINHLSKETMADERLTFVEAVGDQGAFFLSATTNNAAAAFTDDFNSCMNYRDLVNSEAKDVRLPVEERFPHHKKPFVSVGIRPAFVLDEDWDWNYKSILDFLKTEEYREAKEIVKNLKI